jgi:hypothetical protein
VDDRLRAGAVDEEQIDLMFVERNQITRAAVDGCRRRRPSEQLLRLLRQRIERTGPRTVEGADALVPPV